MKKLRNKFNTIILISILVTPIFLTPSDRKVETSRRSILIGHEKSVTSLILSNDLNILVSGAEDKKIILWDLKTNKLITTLLGHEEFITSLAISNDSKYLLSGGKDNKAILWDLKSEKQICKINKHGKLIQATGISDDSKYFATAGFFEKQIYIWNTSDCTLYKEIIHDDDITTLKFLPEEGSLISGSGGKGIQDLYIWNFHKNELLNNFGEHGDGVHQFTFSKNYIGSGSRNSPLKLWNIKSGQLMNTFVDLNEKLNQTVYSIAISPLENKIAAIYDFNCDLGIWNVNNGKKINSIYGNGICFSEIKFTDENNLLIVKSRKNDIEVMQLNLQL